ncbi:E3 ubiquitin ligase family protein [Haloarcula salinisoli]|uniref:RING-type E3 ubiquitin transferase n=1 Tax=Haloarcula salinisoli TaxID=2487746 RepID=A0A8J7YL58_9EURY|nr:E3 ubiquitin ligase family protein [Halomicroarcula salinisoli]MBX0305341.1 E3 ubiquitin ligase family protein [Halomicroarcula salinisoli]
MVWWVELGAALQSGNLGSRIVPYVFILGGLLFIWEGVREWKRRRLVDDTPTETVRSAAAGRTELEGAGTPIGEPVERPFADGECLVARYRIDRAGGGSSKTIATGTRWTAFEVDDGTGTMRVEPDDGTTFEFDSAHRREVRVDGGEAEPPAIAEFCRASSEVDTQATDSVTRSYFAHDRRYIEWWIPVGTEVYVLGAAELSEDDSGLVLRRDDTSDEFIVSALGPSDALSRTGHGVESLLFIGLLFIGLGLYALVAAM